MPKKTNAQKVRDFVTKHPQPIQMLCPTLIQYWKSGDRYIYWDNKTGERSTSNPYGGRYCTGTVSVRSSYEDAYVAYHRKEDMLEFAFISMTGGRGKDGQTKDWDFNTTKEVYVKNIGWTQVHRVFLFHDEPNPYDSNGNVLWESSSDKYYCKGFYSWLSELSKANYRGFKEQFVAFCGVDKVNKTNGYKFDLDHIWSFMEWYRLAFNTRTSKQGNSLQEYNDRLDEMEWKVTPIKVESQYSSKRYVQMVILDENYCCFRIGRENAPKDDFRVFIDSKGKVTCMVNYTDTWSVTSTKPDIYGYTFMPPVDELAQWKPLKWLIPCVDLNDKGIYNRSGNPVVSFINMLRHPGIEIISKGGYPNIAKFLANGGTFAANLKYYCLVDKELKKGNPVQIIGANKYFLKRWNESLSENTYSRSCEAKVLRTAKELFGDDIINWSEETIDQYYDSILTLCNTWRWKRSILGWTWRQDRDKAVLNDEEKATVIHLLKMEKKENGILDLYQDVKSTYDRIRNKPDINIDGFTDYNDLLRMHNSLVEIANIEEAERRAIYDAQEKERQEKLKKKFDKLQKERIEKYEYDGDESDEFCIRIPHELTEITTEGSVLHHCVGGYINRHAIGDTNIIFLRRKAAENVPFYTIEIADNRVVQIHGSHNRWLGNDPEAVPFVYKYLKQLGVKFTNDLLLNKGSGYSKGANSLPESALVA